MQPVQTGFQTFAVTHGEAVIKEQRHVFLWPEKPHHGEPEGKIELLHSARGQRAGRYFSACGKGKQLQIIAHFKAVVSAFRDLAEDAGSGFRERHAETVGGIIGQKGKGR